MASKSSGLVLAKQAEAALTPEQRKFKQLQAKIEKLRADLQAWDEGATAFAQAHARRMQPLLLEMAGYRHRITLRLADLLANGRWSPGDSETLRRSLSELALELIMGSELDAAAVAELKALHERYAETSLEDEQRDALADLKNMVEDVMGVDLGDQSFETEEALRQHVQERLQQAAEQQERSQARQDEKRAKRPARKSAAALKREAQAQLATQSVREVFRKLVSALHPDRASDEADRSRRTGLMQRVNQAYAAQDLLGLFALQLEIEQVDAEHLSKASSEQVRHFNQVLSAQVEELKDELLLREEAFLMQFGLEPWLQPNPRKLGSLLDKDLVHMRARLVRARQEINQLADPVSTKRWIKEMRKQHEVDDEDFELPF